MLTGSAHCQCDGGTDDGCAPCRKAHVQVAFLPESGDAGVLLARGSNGRMLSLITVVVPRCRQGNDEAAARELATACGRPLPLQHGVKPTLLFARNAEVDAVNSRVRAHAPRALQLGVHQTAHADVASCRSASVHLLVP